MSNLCWYNHPYHRCITQSWYGDCLLGAVLLSMAIPSYGWSVGRRYRCPLYSCNHSDAVYPTYSVLLTECIAYPISYFPPVFLYSYSTSLISTILSPSLFLFYSPPSCSHMSKLVMLIFSLVAETAQRTSDSHLLLSSMLSSRWESGADPVRGGSSQGRIQQFSGLKFKSLTSSCLKGNLHLLTA